MNHTSVVVNYLNRLRIKIWTFRPECWQRTFNLKIYSEVLSLKPLEPFVAEGIH
jgi:hypothetical protein